jgi:hypothetical protein
MQALFGRAGPASLALSWGGGIVIGVLLCQTFLQLRTLDPTPGEGLAPVKCISRPPAHDEVHDRKPPPTRPSKTVQSWWGLSDGEHSRLSQCCSLYTRDMTHCAATFTCQPPTLCPSRTRVLYACCHALGHALRWGSYVFAPPSLSEHASVPHR